MSVVFYIIRAEPQAGVWNERDARMNKHVGHSWRTGWAVDSSKRFVTVVLGLGALVLVLAIFIGERMGNRVLGSAVEERGDAVQTIVITPGPQQSGVPYGPDWKRSQ